jgi:arginyl-tRNA synthetase
MKPLRILISDSAQRVFQDLGFESRWGAVTIADRPDLADFQCNGALGAAKQKGAKPRELAEQVVTSLRPVLAQQFGDGEIELSIAGPGFINFKVGAGALARSISSLAGDHRCGVPVTPQPRRVVVDYGGPNVAKMMHVGHLRSSIIGDALVRIHRFQGDTVIGDNHLGDWGTQMGMLICEIRRNQPDLPYFKDGFSGPFPTEPPVSSEDLVQLYPVASKRYKEDPDFEKQALEATTRLQHGTHAGYRALWKHFVDCTVSELKRDFAALGIEFDTWYGESFYEDKMPPMVEDMKKRGIAVPSEGAWIVPLATEKEPDAPPLILVKSGGGFIYHTSDLATIQFRAKELKADLMLYAVDKRQSLHFKQVFTVAKMAGLSGHAEMFHASFGTMNGKDGKPFKTREGGVLKLRDLIEMVNAEARKRVAEVASDRGYSAQEMEDITLKVGIATLKYADLKNNRTADYVFDLERFSQLEGNTGPYLLYAAVRIKSILRKAADQGFRPSAQVQSPRIDAERKLMLELARLPDVMARAYELREPHHLADFGFALAQAFNSFYKECHILTESDAGRRGGWLQLCQLVHDELVLCLDLLGIQVPARM